MIDEKWASDRWDMYFYGLKKAWQPDEHFLHALVWAVARLMGAYGGHSRHFHKINKKAVAIAARFHARKGTECTYAEARKALMELTIVGMEECRDLTLYNKDHSGRIETIIEWRGFASPARSMRLSLYAGDIELEFSWDKSIYESHFAQFIGLQALGLEQTRFLPRRPRVVEADAEAA